MLKKFSLQELFGKSTKIHRKLVICSHLLKKSLMENIICGAVSFLEISELSQIKRAQAVITVT